MDWSTIIDRDSLIPDPFSAFVILQEIGSIILMSLKKTININYFS